MAPSTIARRITRHARTRGLAPVVADCASWAGRWAIGRPLIGRPTAPFGHDGATLPYLRHPYHYTWLNERAVEVPLAESVLTAAAPSARVLEIGNVLAHYRPVTHTVVDKYEQAP